MSGGVLCCLHCCTTGAQGPNLGSDETETVLLLYAFISLSNNQVLGARQYVVRPADLADGFISDQLLQEANIDAQTVRTLGLPLEKAIQQADSDMRRLDVDPSSITFITDGQLPLRQVLHPEACRSGLTLPHQYTRFCDVRKDVASLYNAQQIFSSVPDILLFLDIAHSGETEFYGKQFKDMINIVQRLIADGYKFNNVETISLVLEPGICSKDEEVDSNCVVRARGLPWQSSDQDIAKFFIGLNVAKGGVALCLSPMGRRNGEALVRFASSEHRDMALRRHKHHIGLRYIEVYRAGGEDFVNVAGGSNDEAQAFLTRGAQVIVRMRGLPYDCSPRQVMEFFSSGDDGCRVMDAEEGVLFVRKPDGRSTGDAFVLFRDESDAPRALARHRELIGTRYIELFRSTTAEVQQVLNKTMETFEPAPPLLPQVPLLPQHIITSGTRKDCIRLRGLPYEAQVEHILEFLGDHAKSIVFQGVHMVYNSQGQPSGEAFIQMESEASAFAAAKLRHHRYMTFGKKQRYIEVFQCSGEDMSLVLSGGQLSPGSVVAKPGALLSPGGGGSGGGSYHPQHYPALVGRYPPPTYHPQLVYWPYPSPPVSPPPPPPTLLIMRHDNYLEHWGMDYMGGPPPVGMHSAAA